MIRVFSSHESAPIWLEFSNYKLDNTDRKEIKDKEFLKEKWYNENGSIF